MSVSRAAINTAAACLISIAALLLGESAWAGDGRIQLNHERALAGSITASDTPGYPITLDTPGISYVLIGPLTIAGASTTGIEVTADNVTIDLNGFRMSGPVSCTGAGSTLSCSPLGGTGDGINSTASGTTVRNGFIRGFGRDGVSLGDDARVEDVSFINNGRSAIQVTSGSQSSIVTGCHLIANYDSGVAASGEGLVVEHTQAHWNRFFGISKSSVRWGGRLRGIVVRGNGSDGIDVGSSTIQDSAIFENERYGIQTNAFGSLVRGNSVTSNTSTGLEFLSTNDGYSHNSLNGNGATVTNGVNMGSNNCSGSPCP